MFNVNVTWTLPTTRKPSGRPLPLEEIAGVEVSISANGVDFSTPVFVPSNQTGYPFTELEDGTWHFRGRCKDTDGRPGEYLTASITHDESPPGPLESFTVELA